MRTIGFVIGVALFPLGCGAPYTQLPPGAPAVYFDAQTALRMGNNERAIESFTLYLQEADNPSFRPRAYYQLAQAQYAAKRYEAALTTLDQLKAEFPDDKWPQVPALTGDIQYALEDRTAAILSWEQAWAIGTDPDRAVLRPRQRWSPRRPRRWMSLRMAPQQPAPRRRQKPSSTHRTT